MILTDNIVKLFVTDTFICATHALQLMKYQMEKHGWTTEQWNEYYKIYTDNLNHVGLLDDNTNNEDRPKGKCSHPPYAIAREYMSQPYGTCVICGITVFGV